MISCSGSSCRNAIQPGCVCACGGANHGMGRLLWAYAAVEDTARPVAFGEVGSAELDRYQRVVAQRSHRARAGWFSEVVDPLEQGSARFSNKMGWAAALKITDDDAVLWLARNPQALVEVKFLSEQIGAAAEEELTVLVGKAQWRRLADHFWCDVVGALVCLLEEVDGAVEKLQEGAIDWLVDQVWTRVRSSRSTDHGSTPNGRRQPESSRADHDHQEGIADEILKAAIKSLLAKICDGLIAKDLTLNLLILKLRLLAIWLCPAILAHKVVLEHCWNPLAQGWVEAYVQKLMEGVFPLWGRGVREGY